MHKVILIQAGHPRKCKAVLPHRPNLIARQHLQLGQSHIVGQLCAGCLSSQATEYRELDVAGFAGRQHQLRIGLETRDSTNSADRGIIRAVAISLIVNAKAG